MGGSFKIGRFSGIDVEVHWTFFLLLAFFAFIGYQASGSLAGALTPIAVIVALFICVVLHEFGHSLVAQRLGIEIHSITLLPIGGVSNLESLPEKPSDEVKITLAGPLVNVVLARSSSAWAFFWEPNLACQPTCSQGSGRWGSSSSIWATSM